MAGSPAQAPDSSVRSDLAPSGRLLRGRGRTSSTVVTCSRAVDRLGAHLDREGLPQGVREIRRRPGRGA